MSKKGGAREGPGRLAPGGFRGGWVDWVMADGLGKYVTPFAPNPGGMWHVVHGGKMCLVGKDTPTSIIYSSRFLLGEISRLCFNF